MLTLGWRTASALLPLLAVFGCSSTSGPPQRTDLQFGLRVAQEINFDREWVTVTFDDGTGAQTVGGADFVGFLASGAETETFVLPAAGRVAIHVEIASDGVVIGKADVSLELGQNRRYLVRIVLSPMIPVPCFSCQAWEEIPFTGGSLGVDTFWVITLLASIEGGGIV